MRDVRRSVTRSVAALAGAAVGASAILLLGDVTHPGTERTTSLPRVQATIERARGVDVAELGGAVLLAWTPGSLPRSSEAVVERIPGVLEASTVHAGLDWIVSTRNRGGAVIDRPPSGYEIPFEVAVVEPDEFVSFVAPGERAQIASLRPGDVVLSRTEAGLRGGGQGLRIELRDRVIRSIGVVSDESAQGYEALMAGPPPAGWRRADRFLLVRIDRMTVRDRVERRLRSLLGDSIPLRVRAFGETPFLRYGDAVLPQMMVKEAFGEFAARPDAGGSIQVDPVWLGENIVTQQVPLLGRVTCHRLLVPQLRAALRELQQVGAADKIDPSQFAGCFNARFIGRDPDARLSHHSWGIAVDLNSLENPSGARPRIDRDVVAVMERHGFTWGGRWLVPDGMHFEWVRFP